MGTTEVRSDEATEGGSVRTGDMKRELVVIPMTDAERAKLFRRPTLDPEDLRVLEAMGDRRSVARGEYL